MNSQLSNLSAQKLREAANLRERIDSLERQLGRLLGSSPAASYTAVTGKRMMSAAARARIAAGARARWARIKGNSQGSKAPAQRRTLSAAAKARLSAIAKARWKKARAQGKKAL